MLLSMAQYVIMARHSHRWMAYTCVPGDGVNLQYCAPKGCVLGSASRLEMAGSATSPVSLWAARCGHTAAGVTEAPELLNFDKQVLLQVRAYSKVFWKRHKDINDWEKHIKNIEGGEARIQRQTDIMNAIASKMNRYKNPHQVRVGHAL